MSHWASSCMYKARVHESCACICSSWLVDVWLQPTGLQKRFKLTACFIFWRFGIRCKSLLFDQLYWWVLSLPSQLKQVASNSSYSLPPCLRDIVFNVNTSPKLKIDTPNSDIWSERSYLFPSTIFILLNFQDDRFWYNFHFSSQENRKVQKDDNHIMIPETQVVWLAAISLLGFWWYLCHLRVDDWKSVEQITLVDGLKQLRSSRTQFNLANLYLQSQRCLELHNFSGTWRQNPSFNLG